MANRRVAPPRLLAALAGLLLLTFGLRVAGLETQSIWVDEGFSIDFSSRTASDMLAMWKGRGGVAAITDMQAAQAASDPLAIAVDIHPPLYYLILHEWLPLAGRGEYAVRFPSVIVGTLLVLLLYTLGAGLVGRGVGLAAAGVGGIAPFYIAYSQEARMYAPVALLGGFSLYFCWRTMATSRQASGIRRQWFIWLGLVVSSSLALYTHYSAVLVIGAENALVAVALLAEVARRRPWARLLIAWASSQLVELALFFPWLRTTIGQVAKYNENLWVPNWQHELTETFRAFDAGLWLPSDESLRLAMAVSVILLAGLAAAGWLWRSSVRRAMPPLPLMAGAAPAAEAIAAPLVARAPRPLRQPAPRSRFGRGLLFGAGALLLQTAVALAAFQVRPEFHPRYLMVLATPYYLLLGLALAALWRRWRPAGLLAGAGLAAIFAVGLRGYEFDPNFAKDDSRTLAQYLASRTSADDVIFVDAPEPLGYYYHGPAAIYSILGDESTVAQNMTDKAAGKKRVVFVQWFLSTSDAEQLVPFLLQKYGKVVDDHTFRGYWEHTYLLPPNTSFELTPADTPAAVNFDNVLRLEASGLGPGVDGQEQLVPLLEKPAAESGGNLLVALKWQLLRPVAKDYKVSLYLTDGGGNLAGSADLLLRHGQATTTRWPAGQEATNYYVLHTLPGLMPGPYMLNAAVYPEGGQERLSVLDSAGAPGGGNAAIGKIDVLPSTSAVDPASLNPPHPMDQPLASGISVIGYDVPSGPVAQGDALRLTLFWKATAKPQANLKTTLALRRPGESELAWQTDVQPRYPTDRWAAGDAFRDWYAPVLPAQLPAGDYELLVGLGGPMASIGQVQVQELQRTFAAPAPEHPLKANLGGTIELLGYDQDRPSYKPGSTARIILYWQGAAPMTDSYTAFVHVLDAGQHVVAQVDSIPAHAQLPTTAWLPGQVVSDAYDLPLKADLPPGAYQLEVGFYRGDTGIRLKASSTDVRAIDDGLLIGTLTVSG